MRALAFLLLAAAPAACAGPGGPDSSAPSCAGALRVVADVPALRQAVEDVQAGRLAPGSVIRLAPGLYPMDRNGRPISFKDVAGTSEDCPITLEGSGPRSVIDGSRRPGTTYFQRRVAPRTGLDAIERLEGEGGSAVQPEGMPREELINCLKVKRSSWIVVRNLTLRDCWPSALFLRDASYVTLRDTTIVGASYAAVAYGASHHILVEANDWTQDPSGRMWAAIPWGVSHHGSRSYFNGALFGAKDIPGGVIVRRNTIRHAYNGVRMKGTRCSDTHACPHNLNVEIAANDFRVVRDNPVEPEGYAANWWVHHNRIVNAHAWFSFQGTTGGPHYVFGNVGWFDEVPGRACEDRDWAGDRDPAGQPTPGRECGRSRIGKVLKLGNAQRAPLYVFHNSWRLRAPVAGGGRSGPLKHWNNAVAFCAPGRDAACAPAPFFSTIPGDELIWVPGAYDFRHDLSNHPDFPERLRAEGYAVHGRRVAGLGFAGGAGDFRLGPDSPARGAGCRIGEAGDGALTCSPVPPGAGPDVGAYQGEAPVRGPAVRHADGPGGPDTPYVERPRLVALDLRALAAGRFAMTFSVPLAHAGEAVPVALERAGTGETLAASCRIAGPRGARLACMVSEPGLEASAVAGVLIPRTIVRREGRRAPVTLWGRGDARVRFAD